MQLQKFKRICAYVLTTAIIMAQPNMDTLFTVAAETAGESVEKLATPSEIKESEVATPSELPEKDDESEDTSRDFSSLKLVVGVNDKKDIREEDSILSSYKDLYLLDFDNEADTEDAYNYYKDKAEYVEPDTKVYIATAEETSETVEETSETAEETSETAEETSETAKEVEESNSESLADIADDSKTAEEVEKSDDENNKSGFKVVDNKINTENTDEKSEEASKEKEDTESDEEDDLIIPDIDIFEDGIRRVDNEEALEDSFAIEKIDNEDKTIEIALIDTGIKSEDTRLFTSVISDDGLDRNGHGHEMVGFIYDEYPDSNILSIKALDDNGEGNLSSVAAAMKLAIENKVKVINLSITAESVLDNTVINSLIDEADIAGIKVVCAAGNNSEDVRKTIFGHTNNAYVIGACDEDGEILETSNTGAGIDYYVRANSTSEAAARFSGYLVNNDYQVNKSDITNDNCLILGEGGYIESDLFDENSIHGISGSVAWEIIDNTLTLKPTNGDHGEFAKYAFVNEDGKEKQTPWADNSDDIKNIKIEDGVGFKSNADADGLFSDLQNLENIEGIENLDLTNIKSVKNLFTNDKALKVIDISSWDLSGVQSDGMDNMFTGTYPDEILTNESFNNMGAEFPRAMANGEKAFNKNDELLNGENRYFIPTISFDGTDGNGSMSDVQPQDKKEISIPDNEYDAPEGGRFIGWSVEEQGDEILVSDLDKESSKDIVDSTDLTISDLDIKSEDTEELEIATPSEIKKETIDVEDAEEIKYELPEDTKTSIIPTDDLTLYAQWIYKATFNPNGAETLDIKSIEVQNGHKFSSMVNSLPVASKTGYIFEGWFDSEDNKLDIEDTIPTGGAVYVAKWTPINYIIRIHANDEESKVAEDLKVEDKPARKFVRSIKKLVQADKNDDVQEITATYDQEVTLDSTFNRPRYKIVGYNTKADGTGIEYPTLAKVMNLANESNGSVDLYAHWELSDWYDKSNTQHKAGTYVVTIPTKAQYNDMRVGKVDESFNYDVNVTGVIPDDVKVYIDTKSDGLKNGDNTINVAIDQGHGGLTQENGKYFWSPLNIFGKEETGTKDGTNFKYITGITTQDKATLSGEAKYVGEYTGDIEYKITQNDNFYSIKYNLNGGNFEPNVDQHIYYYLEKAGRTITEKPIRAGYTFTGWTVTEGNESEIDSNNNIVIPEDSKGDRVYAANWTANTYQVVYYANNGSTNTQSQNVTYDAKWTTKGSTFTKTGYTQTSWNTSPDGTGTKYNFSKDQGIWKRTENLNLYAIYNVNSYKASFNTVYDNKVIESRNRDYGAKLGTLPTPSRTGYKFDGWFTASNGGTQISADTTMPASDITYYAHWTINVFNITFNGNGGTIDGALTKVVSKEYNAALGTLPAALRTGYSQNGWWTDASSGTQISENTQMPNNNVSYFAHWNLINYTIAYLNCSVSGNPTSYNIESPDITIKNPSRTGYTFTGWTGSNGTTPQKTVTISANSTGDKSYTANWKAHKYKIVFDGNKDHNINKSVSGSTTSMDMTYDEAKNLTANGFSTTGYTFNGWNTKPDGSGTKYSDKQSVTNLTDSDGATVTLYAQWKINQYTVTRRYSLQNADGSSYGSYITIDSKAYPYGTTISGWSRPQDDTYQAASIAAYTVEAKNDTLSVDIKRRVYSITYDLAGGVATGEYPQNYRAGQSITIADPTKVGYTFAGWTVTNN